jgi:hypothetical protein
MDPGEILSAEHVTFAERRAVLVAHAAAEREALAGRLAPLGNLDGSLGKLRAMRFQLPSLALGTGLGLSALLLALPTGRIPLVRGGIAVLHLAGSIRRLLSPR